MEKDMRKLIDQVKNFGKSLNEGTIVSKKEFDEMKNFLENGGILQNDTAGYHILIKKDGDLVFDINGVYKFFKNRDAFIKAAIRTVKRGG